MTAPFDALPVVLAFNDNDPTGGTGIQADTEALISMGCHCLPVITAITPQDTCTRKSTYPLPASLIIEQARRVLEDIPVHAFKIGRVGSTENVAAIHSILADYPHLPVVINPNPDDEAMDPIGDEELMNAITSMLAHQATIVVADQKAAQRLTPSADNYDACAQGLMAQECKFVLLVDTTQGRQEHVNILYGNRRQIQRFSWPRPSTASRGLSTTLTASLAGLLAQGLEVSSAVHEAQEYTWTALKQPHRLGMGQHVANRLFWAGNERT